MNDLPTQSSTNTVPPEIADAIDEASQQFAAGQEVDVHTILSKNLEIMRTTCNDHLDNPEHHKQFLSKSRAFFVDLSSTYYAWLAASAAGPLKAHLLLLWLLHGGSGLRDCFDDIGTCPDSDEDGCDDEISVV